MKQFVKNGMANFSQTGLTEKSGPPPEVIPDIPVGRKDWKQTFPFDFRVKFMESLV